MAQIRHFSLNLLWAETTFTIHPTQDQDWPLPGVEPRGERWQMGRKKGKGGSNQREALVILHSKNPSPPYRGPRLVAPLTWNPDLPSVSQEPWQGSWFPEFPDQKLLKHAICILVEVPGARLEVRKKMGSETVASFLTRVSKPSAS